MVVWLNAPKGIPTTFTTPSLFQEKVAVSNHTQSFLNDLSNQQDITQLLNTNLKQHQDTLIQHNLDDIDQHDSLIQKLLTANPLTISTHNTRKIADTIKYSQLLDTLSLHNVDFCGLTETGHAKGQPYKLTQHSSYTAFWSTVINRHAGVGLVLYRKWCSFVQNTFLHSDRFIYVDLFFKGNIKVRIIVVYLHADPTARLQRQAVQSQLIDLLNTSQNANYHTIIMGDFNAHLERFYHSVSKNNKGRWQYT